MRKKHFLAVFMAFSIAVTAFGAKAPKYVFLLIGDGMGANQVNLTEMYLKSLEGELGYKHLTMSTFPVVSFATTYCSSREITDSAASGTALATGSKTNARYIGVDVNGTPLETIAEKAKKNGKKVGIVTSVGINNATPAAFYAHREERGDYDNILQDLVTAGFDFYGGSDYCYIKDNTNQKIFPQLSEGGKQARDNYLNDAGFAVVRDQSDYEKAYKDAGKMVMLPNIQYRHTYDFASKEQRSSMMLLKELTEDAIGFLMKDGCKKGFFMMVEGGAIDSADHGSDAACSVREIIDFDETIQVIYNFYLKHPKETAIVITADHDTGGISLTGRSYKEYACLQYQDTPQEEITKELRHLMKTQKEVVSWEQVKDMLDSHLGLWSKMNISADDEAVIRAEYDNTVAKRESGHVVDSYAYADNAKIVKVAIKVYDKMCGVSWPDWTRGHTAGYVPVYAIGKGTDIFNGLNDNTDICKKLVKIAKYK